jgi:chorismate synthase
MAKKRPHAELTESDAATRTQRRGGFSGGIAEGVNVLLQ